MLVITIAGITAAAITATSCAINSAPAPTDASSDDPVALDVEGDRSLDDPDITGRADSTGAVDVDLTADPTPVPTLAVAPVPSPTPFMRPPAPTGRVAPAVADNAADLAEQITVAERGLRDPTSTPEQLADFGHLQQIAYRKLGRSDAWTNEVFDLLPPEYQINAAKQVEARRSLRGLSSGFDAADFVPAWEIIEPEPAAALLGYYAEAQGLTGIDWEYLAAINLIETGLGRINGLSSAGAQGPMQFIPTTWDEVGEGDVNDPRDAINAAARYLVRRGGPEDMDGALWGYNNSDQYVAVVSTYADLLRGDPSAFTGLYNWEIYFWTEQGDVWLPVGFRAEEQIDLDEYLTSAPWSLPDPNLS